MTPRAMCPAGGPDVDRVDGGPELLGQDIRDLQYSGGVHGVDRSENPPTSLRPVVAGQGLITTLLVSRVRIPRFRLGGRTAAPPESRCRQVRSIVVSAARISARHRRMPVPRAL